MRRYAIALALAALLCIPVQAVAAPRLTPVVTVDKPMQVTAPAGDAHRLFVPQRRGLVKIVRDGTVLADPFLDVSADLSSEAVDRTGLASIAFAPDYETSGHVYALYSAPPAAGGSGIDVVLDEYTRSITDPDKVDPLSKRNVLRLDFSNTTDHDADHVEFGPDGLLYLTIGEGLVDADKAQDPHELRGKVLRIDPRPDGSNAYTIPPGNPFADGVGGMPEVFAYGLRNPWRFSFDAKTRELLVADVGEGQREELDAMSIDGGSANFGWPCWEGTLPHNTCTAPDHVAPAFEYPHTNNRCSIIGGYVGRDPQVPSLLDRYVYGDFCSSEVRSLGRGWRGATDEASGTGLADFGLNSFGEDGCGHLYVVSVSGGVWRVDENAYVPCAPAPPAPGGGDLPPATDPGDGTPNPPPDPGPGDGTTPPDRTPPVLRLTSARVQRVLRNRVVVVGARCNEGCRLSATASLVRGSKQAAQFRATARRVKAHSRVKLKPRETKAARKLLRRSARRRKRVLIRVVVTASDAAGNKTTAKRFIAAIG